MAIQQNIFLIKEVSELILKKRMLMEISRLSLACDIGIDEKQIRRIEKGESKLPLVTLLKLFKALKIEITVLDKYLKDEDLLCS